MKDETNLVIDEMLEVDHINIVKSWDTWYNNNIETYDEKDQELIKFGAMMMSNNLDSYVQVLEDIDMDEELKGDILNASIEYNEDEYEWAYYDKEQNDLAVYNADLENAKEQGIKQGVKQGVEQIAKEMLLKEIDIDTISEITKLSKDDILKLKEV